MKRGKTRLLSERAPWAVRIVSTGVNVSCRRKTRIKLTITTAVISLGLAVDLNAIARTSGAFSQSPPETNILSSSPVRNMNAVSPPELVVKA